MIQYLLSNYSKLLVAALLFSFYSCGTPTNTEMATEVDPNTEVQLAVNAEANTEQENMEYAEKSEATNQAISFYEALKNGLYQTTTELVEKNIYKNYSEAAWLESLKKIDKERGNVESYELKSSKYQLVEGTNSGRKVEFTFEVTRNGKKCIEEMDWYKTDREPFLLTEMEYKREENTKEDDD